MIPMGTKCIVVAGSVSRWFGKVCRVVGGAIRREHLRDAILGWDVAGDEIEIEFDDGTDAHLTCYARPLHLIPIGHDPDTETRTTDREVAA